MKRKKDYRSKGEKFFLEYIPTEVFDSLKPKERENYQKYRTHHRYIFEGWKAADITPSTPVGPEWRPEAKEDQDEATCVP